MKIGIIADTHGCANTWERIYNEYFFECDYIIHAGDILYHGPRNDIPEEYQPKHLAALLNECPVPIIAVCGNCDSEVDGMVITLPIQSPYAFVMFDGLRIVVNHGHNLTEQTKRELAAKYKADVFITGHTHVPLLESHEGIIYLNPGSPAMSKRNDGKGTFAILSDTIIEIFDVATGQVLMSQTLSGGE